MTMLTIASPEGIRSQNLALDVYSRTGQISDRQKYDILCCFLPFVLARIAVAHWGPICALDRERETVNMQVVRQHDAVILAMHVIDE